MFSDHYFSNNLYNVEKMEKNKIMVIKGEKSGGGRDKLGVWD